MSWSIKQTHQIVEEFWQHGTVRCPDDNGPLKLKLRRLHGGDYDLHAECPVCSKRNGLRRGDDPLRRTFRRWTTVEYKGNQEDRTRQIRLGVWMGCFGKSRSAAAQHSYLSRSQRTQKLDGASVAAFQLSACSRSQDGEISISRRR